MFLCIKKITLIPVSSRKILFMLDQNLTIYHKKIQIHKIIAVISFFIIFLLFDYSYKSFIHPTFYYMGYDYQPDTVRTFVAYLLLLLYLFLFVIIPMTDFMFFVNSLVYLFYLISALVVFKNHPDYRYIILFFNLLFVSLMLIISPIKIRFRQPKFKIDLITTFLIILALSVPFFLKFKLNFSIKSLTDFLTPGVDLRRTAFQNINSWQIYLYSWLSKIFIPVFLIMSIIRKRYGLTILGFVLMLYFYLNFTQKVVFYGAILVTLLAFINDYKKLTLALILGLIFSVLVGISIRLLKGNYLIEGLFVKRIFILPQLLNVFYFDFFHAQKLHLSYSFLSPFFHYHYKVTPPFLIGKEYFHNPMISANNGFISQGYMDFGYLGVIVYTLIIVVIWLYFNSLDIHPAYSGMFLILFFSFVSSFWTTVIVTHGAIWLIILAYFMLDKYRTNPSPG